MGGAGFSKIKGYLKVGRGGFMSWEKGKGRNSERCPLSLIKGGTDQRRRGGFPGEKR